MDPATLAAQIVASYLVPYVKEGAEKLVSAAAEKVGGAAAEFATSVAGKLWLRVKSVFSGPNESQTLSDFEKYPDDTEKLLVRKLTEKLEADTALAKELESLAEQPGPTGVNGAQVFAQTGIVVDLRQADLRGAHNFDITGYKAATPPETHVGNRPPLK